MLTIIEAEHQSATLYARVVQASAASGELVISGEPTDEQIRAAANCQLAAPEIGDYSHYVVVWDNKTIKDKKWHIEVAASNVIQDFAGDLNGVVDRLEMCNPGARCSIARISDNRVFFEGTVSRVIDEIRFRMR